MAWFGMATLAVTALGLYRTQNVRQPYLRGIYFDQIIVTIFISVSTVWALDSINLWQPNDHVDSDTGRRTPTPSRRHRRSLAAVMRTATASRIFLSRTQPRRWLASHTETSAGTKTPLPDEALNQKAKSPFYFDTGYALFAKRPSRPFPPPFLSPPSGSFSDPLSTYHRSRDRRQWVNGEMIRGITNGDDAVLVGENFIGANDGVGAWGTRPKGHAAYVLPEVINTTDQER